MRIALEKVGFLPPDRVTDDTSVLTLKTLVLEPMLRWADGALAPGLFGSWALSADGRRWDLELRDGARWHDGAPVRAEEAAAFIDAMLRSRDTFGMPWSYARYLEGARIDADATTLAVETPEPFPDLPDILSEFYLPRATGAGEWAIGTGPWRVEGSDPGSAVRLSHGDGRRIEVRAIPDAEDRLRALRDGTVDAATHLERLTAPRRSLPSFAWIEQPVALSVIAYLNGASGPFADASLRLAANLAVDRERLVEEVMGGLGLPARTVVSPWHMGFPEARLAPIAHDPEAARRLVARSGATGEVVLRTPLHMPERAPEIAAFVARAWDAVGLAVTIDAAGDRADYARSLGAKRMGDAAIFDSSPHSTFRVLDDKVSSDSRGVWWQGVVDPTADRLFAAARRAVDGRSRAEAYGRVLSRLQEAPPWLYLFHPIECAAHRPGLPSQLALDHKGTLRIS